jgi:hypothetical protein
MWHTSVGSYIATPRVRKQVCGGEFAKWTGFGKVPTQTRAFAWYMGPDSPRNHEGMSLRWHTDGSSQGGNYVPLAAHVTTFVISEDPTKAPEPTAREVLIGTRRDGEMPTEKQHDPKVDHWLTDYRQWKSVFTPDNSSYWVAGFVVPHAVKLVSEGHRAFGIVQFIELNQTTESPQHGGVELTMSQHCKARWRELRTNKPSLDRPYPCKAVRRGKCNFWFNTERDRKDHHWLMHKRSKRKQPVKRKRPRERGGRGRRRRRSRR